MRTIVKPPHGSPEWLELRRRDAETGECLFGASDAPALMGVSPYVSRGDLFISKRFPANESVETDVFRRGNILEPALVAEAARLLRVEMRTPNVMYRDGRFIVTLDGCDDEQRPSVVVEAKTTSRYSVSTASDLPLEWAYQGWAQSLVTSAPVFFIVLDRDLRISLVQLPENQRAFDELRHEADRFGSMVEANELPPSDFAGEMSAEQIANLWKPQPKEIELPADAVGWIEMLEDARDQADAAKRLEQQAKDALARLMLEAEIGTLGGRKVLSWKQQAGRTSLDAKALRAEMPEIATRFERQGAPYRVMRIHKPSE
jgi:predicted phage-related endonuclease